MQKGVTMKTIIQTLTILLFSANAFALECQSVGHSDGNTHDIGAKLHTYTHIVLPENIMQNTKPIIGNSDLWVADFAGPHIYIKPNSNQKPGATTSLSAVGESGKSYDFKVVRKKDLDNNCYKLVQGVLFSPSAKQALTLRSDNSSNELAALWRDKYSTMKRQAEDEKTEAILEALRRYRYQIYTRYKWGRGSGFIGRDLISDVYDDGRFTYIRVHNQNKGLLMVEAKLAGEVEIVEAKFDTLNKMYTVSGIFPEFTLKYGDSKLKISRADNDTVGEY